MPRFHWRKLEVWSVVVFHWLGCHSLSLAGSLRNCWEEEKIFLLLVGVVK